MFFAHLLFISLIITYSTPGAQIPAPPGDKKQNLSVTLSETSGAGGAETTVPATFFGKKQDFPSTTAYTSGVGSGGKSSGSPDLTVTGITSSKGTSITGNTWYVSDDDGSDDNDCQTAAAPCKNLQTVLDRASDGADIYVTSPTLPLDLIVENAEHSLYVRTVKACIVESILSHQISSLDGSQVHLTCQEGKWIKWTISHGQNFSSAAKLTLNNVIIEIYTEFKVYSSLFLDNCTINTYLVFEVYGSLTFDNCAIVNSPLMFIVLLKSDLEEVVSFNTRANIPQYLRSHRVTIHRSTVEVEDFDIFLKDTVGEICITQCAFYDTELSLYIAEHNLPHNATQSYLATFHLHIDQSYFNRVRIDIKCQNTYTFGTVSMTRSTLHGVMISQKRFGYIGYLFKHMNITTENFKGFEFNSMAYVVMQNCIVEVKLDICKKGCILKAQACDVEYQDFFFKAICQLIPCEAKSLTFMIDSSLFQGSITGITDTVVYSNIAEGSSDLTNSIFNIKQKSSSGGYIDYRSAYVTISNATFNASETNSPATIMKSQFDFFGKGIIQNLNVVCSRALKVNYQQRNIQYQYEVHSLSCEKACQKDSYTFDNGQLMLVSSSITKNIIPKCLPCPLGAECDGYIKALPNYWGYKNRSFVTMLRCPDSYCCKDFDTCQGIDFCNTGRTGTLCGVCESNLTESLFSPSCVPVEVCSKGIILSLYVFYAVVYATVLATARSLKSKLIDTLKNTSKTLRRKVSGLKGQHRRNKLGETSDNTEEIASIEMKTYDEGKQGDSIYADEDDSDGFIEGLHNNEADNVESTEGLESTCKITDLQKKKNNSRETTETVDEKKDSGMKYLQILLYYVQDSCLFKVHLPSEAKQSENLLIKIFQFSPEVLLTAYKKVSELCWVSADAVFKVIFKSIFGPSVMLVLICFYTLHRILSKFLFTNSEFWIASKAWLVEAFFLCVLFSYQQLVTGAFSLIQCVDVGERKNLYLQGSIECYSWWQGVIQAYIYVNIVPLFFTLSNASFYLKEKSMSVRMFIWVCLVPVPAMIFFHILRCIQGRKKNKMKDQKLKNKETRNETELKKMIEVISPAAAESSVVPETVSHACTKNEKIMIESSSQEAILHTLVDHYRTISVCGIRFNWLCIHKMYRLLLVFCNTYITDPLSKLLIMTALLIIVSIGNNIVKPHKDRRANTAAMLSYSANLCIAILNFGKTFLVTFDCKTNCSIRDSILEYFETVKKMLLVYSPLIALVGWITYTGIQKCSKSKN